jgi:hypothetical protein
VEARVTESGTPRSAIAAIALSLALGVGGAVLRTVGATPVERSAQVAGTVAFAVVFLAPAILGLLSLRGRPSLLVAAGALDVVLGTLALISGVGLVFFVPAVLFFIAAGRAAGSGAGIVRSGTAVVVSVVLGTVAFFALFLREDPVCWARIGSTRETVEIDASRFVHGSTIRMGAMPPGATESGCSSDSISTTEAAASLALVAVMLLLAWSLSSPRRLIPAPAATPS